MTARGWDSANERHLLNVVEMIDAKFPKVRSLLRNDVDREELRVTLQCPHGHAVETVVLDEDTNGYYILRSLAEWQSGDFTTGAARNAVPGPGERPDSMTMARQKLPCRRKRCNYEGTFSQAELLKYFVMARFVLDTPGIRLSS